MNSMKSLMNPNEVFHHFFLRLVYLFTICNLKSLWIEKLTTLVDEQTFDNDAPQVSNVMLIVDKFGKQKS